jgi:uncharacterized membrane protein
MVNPWLHLLSLTAFLGALIGLWLILLPALSAVQQHAQKVELLARGLKFYNPLQIGALGVVLLSGAFHLTELKAAYREMFITHLGSTLGPKLVLSFFLILVAVYQSMGVGHRFVKRHEGGESVSPEELSAVVRRLKRSTWLLLLLALITLWVGLGLRR